ncbi:MAG: hypothetical protein KIT14_21490 [bacterium]|nr:hypothetical protein [bacterium]
MRMGRALAVLALGVAGIGGLAVARTTVGTVRASGAVEANVAGAWEPFHGGALGEGAQLRVGPGGNAILETPDGDVVGIAPGALVVVESAVPARLRLDEGTAQVKLRPTSALALDTAYGALRAPLTPAGDDDGRATVTVNYADAQVAVHRGNVALVRPGGVVIDLYPGQTAQLDTRDEGVEITSLAGRPGDPNAPRLPGNPASDPKIMVSPIVAQTVVGAAITTMGFLLGFVGI